MNPRIFSGKKFFVEKPSNLIKTSKNPRSLRMEKAIGSFLKKISFLKIVDESHLHSGRRGTESHFKIYVVSSDFEGKSPLKRQKSLMDLFRKEFQEGLHALSLSLKTPQEDRGGLDVSPSPPCRKAPSKKPLLPKSQGENFGLGKFGGPRGGEQKSDPKPPLLNIVLYQPEIPSNTGNIGRICVAHSSHLHLVGPLGFSLDEKQVRRAGLDYWPHLKYTYYTDFADFLENNPVINEILMMTTKATQVLDHHQFQVGDWVLFGPETRGLPSEMYSSRNAQSYKIPMSGPTRSLNLANAVSIVSFEALRQFRCRGILNC